MAVKANWAAVRTACEAGMTHREAAEAFGLSRSTVSRHARAEGWRRTGTEEPQETGIGEMAEELTGLVERLLREGAEPGQARELKEMVSLLKELAALQAIVRRESDGQQTQTVRLVLEDELERWGE